MCAIAYLVMGQVDGMQAFGHRWHDTTSRDGAWYRCVPPECGCEGQGPRCCFCLHSRTITMRGLGKVGEGCSPIQLVKQLRAHRSAGKDGGGDLEDGHGQDVQALGSGLAGGFAEPGHQVLAGDQGLGSRRQQGGGDGEEQALDHPHARFVTTRPSDRVMGVAEKSVGQQEAGFRVAGERVCNEGVMLQQGACNRRAHPAG